MQQLRIALVSCLAIFVLMSCEDETEVVLKSDAEIVGSWSLIRLERGLTANITEYQPQQITLEFSADQVTIKSDDNYNLGFSVGVYEYLVESTDQGEALQVGEGVLNGTFDLSTNQFTIDQRHFDGPLYTFVRN